MHDLITVVETDAYLAKARKLLSSDERSASSTSSPMTQNVAFSSKERAASGRSGFRLRAEGRAVAHESSTSSTTWTCHSTY